MGIVQSLAVLALRPLIRGLCEAAGVKIVGDAAAATFTFLADRFTDHSQRLIAALQAANARAWKALEVALAGETLWSWPEPTDGSRSVPFDVPGSIADSRMVGDVAYVVTYENGSCWGCQEKPATIVTSFKVGAAINKVDQLIYSAQDNTFQGWQRSVSATNQRLYIAGRDWAWLGGTENAGSVIQIVDIANPHAPREVASFVPDVPPGAGRVQSNDVCFDDRGLIYLIDRTRGLHILERT